MITYHASKIYTKRQSLNFEGKVRVQQWNSAKEWLLIYTFPVKITVSKVQDLYTHI